MNILFLYSEIAGYFLACAQQLHRLYGWNLHVVHWPIHPEAPFEFGNYAGIQFYDRSTLSDSELHALYQSITPSGVYVSGWMDKGYMKLAKEIRKKDIPVVCANDNHWRGDIRQRLVSLVSPFHLQKYYSHMWVPGLYQYEFARRLGYSRDHIITGMYSADVAPFQEVYEKSLPLRQQNYPHNFLYVGRYVEIKGITELCEAFLSSLDTAPHDWTLTLVGAGHLKNQLPKHDRIDYQGFVQPKELPFLASSAGCFVLPSRKEPWGVALHEFAAAGLPLITSRVCGAATAFLRPGHNGYLHEPGNTIEIEQALIQITQQSDESLLQMGQASLQLSNQISPSTWAHTFADVVSRSSSTSPSTSLAR